MRVVIIGGGIMGVATAASLVALAPAAQITIVEQDLSFARASSFLSAASIRQQFSTPQNIRLSRVGVEFLRQMPARFGRDPSFREQGYLLLASASGEAVLRDNHRVQMVEGAAIALLNPAEMQVRFPWLNTDGLALGAFGLRDEGWFDPATLHQVLRAMAPQAQWCKGRVGALPREAGLMTAVELTDGTRLPADWVVNAAGPYAARIAAMAGQSLPVEPRKRTVFVLRCPDAPDGLRQGPLIADPAGWWIRPEGDGFIAGITPDTDPAAWEDLDPDDALWEEKLWPALAGRLPAFERCKVTGRWAGWYDYNTVDQNALIGAVPDCLNLLHITGFSGHGLQQAVGAGRGVAELICHGRFTSLDLSVFRPDRPSPLRERNVI